MVMVAGATATALAVRAAQYIVAVTPSGRLGREAGVSGALMEGALLKPSLSLRALLDAGAQVQHALRAGKLPEARRLLAWHLVSRDTATLSPSEVAGAAIESLAENLSDGLVAPLLAYVVGGLSAAYLCRFINTADAMLGYRTPELEWFGKAAARTDDVINLVPARVTAALIALTARTGGGSSRSAARIACRDHARTASPNAGWPMAAMAGALGVRLDKRGAYTLHSEGTAPSWRDIARARRVVTAAAMAGCALTEWLVAERYRR